MLTSKLLANLKAEILIDPDKLYINHTPSEIAAIMSNPVVTKTDILYTPPPPLPLSGDKIGESVIIKDPPVFRVIGSEPGSPNAFTAKDIMDALAS